MVTNWYVLNELKLDSYWLKGKFVSAIMSVILSVYIDFVQASAKYNPAKTMNHSAGGRPRAVPFLSSNPPGNDECISTATIRPFWKASTTLPDVGRPFSAR